MTIDRVQLDRIRTSRAVLVSALRTAGANVNGQAKIKCPFHDDRHPSGSIKQADDSTWRYYCFACNWNGDRSSGDALDVIMRLKKGLSFANAARELGCIDATNDGPPSKLAIKAPHEPEDMSETATECAVRLQNDSELLRKLQIGRGIDRETAAKFGVGVDARKRFWTFPVEVNGAHGRVAIKHHRIEPGDGQTKCYWLPKGTTSLNCWPISLDYPGPVWICPGELKALAVIAAGRSAIGITSGETAALPSEIIDRLEGRSAALACDDDEAGKEWGSTSLEFFKKHDADAMTVNLPLDSAAGLNDVGDYIVSLIENGKSPDEIGATLDSWYEKSDPWADASIGALLDSPETWKPVEYVPSGLARFDDLSGGGFRVGAVTLLVGPPSRGKSQVAIQMAHNAAVNDISVGIISLELSQSEVAQLIAAQSASIPRRWLERGQVRSEASSRLEETRNKLRKKPMKVLDEDRFPGGLDRLQLEQVVKRGVARYGWRMVVLDYLGLLAPSGSDQNDFSAELKNSTALKRIARRCDVAMVVVTALRKTPNTTGKNNKTQVTLQDVLGAGRLVYDAAAVWVVQSEQADVPSGTNPTGVVTLIPLKSRFSGCAAQGQVAQLRWQPGFGSVHSLEGITT